MDEVNHGTSRAGLKRTPQQAAKRELDGNVDVGPNKFARIEEVPEGGDEGWNDELHKEFVSAIFETGLRNASPAVILENMTKKLQSITSERVKSKLQKYRNNKDKSRQEFLEQYDAFMGKLRALGFAGVGTKADKSPLGMLEMLGSNELLGGDVAAYLSFAVMKEDITERDGDPSALSSEILQKGALEYVDDFSGTGIPFPELTESEKTSSLGISMTFVFGLFMSLTQHLMRERAMHEKLNGGESKNAADTSLGDDVGMNVPFCLDEIAQLMLKGDHRKG
eukprot:Nitzschia sp. Nitz4//scaffold128_size63911//8563//9402//NITZ4_006213-RA/size63911-processed-gene-0.127-mRNA-1//-1//CDS//3329534814//2172//frame0